MAKDPAFLFYPGDWMGGTMIMTRHQKGCYIDLLIAQFNNGPLSLESIRTILGQDQAIWTVLSCKFKRDSAGNYFNERLAAEIEKRKQFSESRKANGSKGGRPKASVKPSGLDMGNHTENRNRDESKSPVLSENTGKFCEDLSELEIGTTLEFASITLHRRFTPERISDLWRAFLIQNGEKFQPDRSSRVQHFRNWIKTQPDEAVKKLNGNGNKGNSGNKLGVSEARTEVARNWGTSGSHAVYPDHS